MAKCHIFLSIYIFFTQCFTLFLSWLVCKWVFPVYVWWILSSLFVSGRCYHSISPPYRGICPPHPSYLLLCVCHRSILFTTSPLLPILPLGCNNREQGWEGCPVPTFIVSHSQRDTRTQTLSTHAQACFIVWFATELKWLINSLTYCGIVPAAETRSWWIHHFYLGIFFLLVFPGFFFRKWKHFIDLWDCKDTYLMCSHN